MREGFEALIRATDNSRDRGYSLHALRGPLRPGELLSMNVGSVVEFRGYCLITVNGKTRLKRLPPLRL